MYKPYPKPAKITIKVLTNLANRAFWFERGLFSIHEHEVSLRACERYSVELRNLLSDDGDEAVLCTYASTPARARELMYDHLAKLADRILLSGCRADPDVVRILLHKISELETYWRRTLGRSPKRSKKLIELMAYEGPEAEVKRLGALVAELEQQLAPRADVAEEERHG